MVNPVMVCERKTPGTTREALRGAAVMVGATLLCMMLASGARRVGLPMVGETLASLAFSVALVLSLPFWLMAGQPRRVQAVVVGVTLILLVAIGYIASGS